MPSTQPFLCSCGEIVDVSLVAPGAAFRCPSCDVETQLDTNDPAFLSSYRRDDGVYDMLLRRRLDSAENLKPALPVTKTATDTRSAPDVEFDRAMPAQPDSPAQRNPIPSEETREIEIPATPEPDHSRSRPNSSNGFPVTIGEQLGPFRVDGVLGQGGMGIVFNAFDSSLQRAVALKVLSDQHSRNEELVDRFRREARAAGALTHPNITHIYSIGEDRGLHYFAMELVRGRTLAQLIADREALSDEVAIDYMLQISRGLRAALKKKIIHRDIKPSNLILSDDGVVKITDFGLAKVITSPIEITATGVIIGTPLYMSPEQGKGEPLDHRSDIYSLGCSIYHLICGAPPFEGDSAMKIIVSHITEQPVPMVDRCPRVHRKLATIVDKMISKSPLDRYQDYQSLLEAIMGLRSQTPGAASSTSTRLDGGRGRIVLVAENDQALPAAGTDLKLLSVADVNLELGRHDKALSLYKKVLAEHPELELELGFRILKIHQQRGDREALRSWYERLLEVSKNPSERFYCRWKIMQEDMNHCTGAVATARDTLSDLLTDEIPEEIHERRLRSRLKDLDDMHRKIERDRETSILLIRKSGDLQIELD